MEHVFASILVLVVAACAASAAQSDPLSIAAVVARIDKIRKADGVVAVVDATGKPIPGARVKIEQTRHRFLFGANAFPVLGDSDSEREALYEKRFTDLLNYATLPFYWGAYEPTPGRTREAVVRR